MLAGKTAGKTLCLENSYHVILQLCVSMRFMLLQKSRYMLCGPFIIWILISLCLTYSLECLSDFAGEPDFIVLLSKYHPSLCYTLCWRALRYIVVHFRHEDVPIFKGGGNVVN